MNLIMSIINDIQDDDEFKKGSPVYEIAANVGSEEGSDYIRSIVQSYLA